MFWANGMSAGRSKWRKNSVTLNGQANVLLISPAAYLGEWSTHLLLLLPLSPLFATSAFRHVSLLWQVVTLRRARKSGVGVGEGEGVRHCPVHMWVTLPHPHLHKLLHYLQSYCGYGEAYRVQWRKDCTARVTPNRQKEPEQQPGLHQSSPPRPGVLLTQ